jgi:hypothetical protein
MSSKYEVEIVKKLGDVLVGYSHVKLEADNLQQRNIQAHLYPLFLGITWAEARSLTLEIGLFKRSIGIVFNRHY